MPKSKSDFNSPSSLCKASAAEPDRSDSEAAAAAAAAPVEGFQQRLLAYMYLALRSAGTPLHLGGADVGEQSPDQRAHFFCYHFDTFAGLVVWKVSLSCRICILLGAPLATTCRAAEPLPLMAE